MSQDEFALVHGSGNLFADLGMEDADNQQLKAILAAKIIGVLDARGLSTRAAERLTGVKHSEFVRIRKPDLKRFTADRLIAILNKLGQRVTVEVTLRPKAQPAPHPH